MNGAIFLQPFLTDAVQLAGILFMAAAFTIGQRVMEKIEAKFHLQMNATARASVDGVVEDAVSYAERYADAKITTVGPIETGNPAVACAANFLLAHAADELAQLNHNPVHAIELVQAAMGAKGKTS
jgi:hypothetical protein